MQFLKQVVQPKGSRSSAAHLVTNLSHPFAFLIATVKSLASAVNARDNVYLRPPLARKAVAVRLPAACSVCQQSGAVELRQTADKPLAIVGGL
jgi:hypothetical protein